MMDKHLGNYTYAPSFLSHTKSPAYAEGGCGSGIRKDYYILMTALADLLHATEKSYSFSNLDTSLQLRTPSIRS
jgi:hypothetical protein